MLSRLKSAIKAGGKDLSIATELEISKAVVALQDHKICPCSYRVKSFIIRKGFGAFDKMIKEANGGL